MQGTFYKTTFGKHNLEVYAPEASDQDAIHRIIYDELVKGIVSDSSRKQLESIIDRMICVFGIDTLILGCTELPLIISDEYKGVILLNTVNIHVRALVDFIL
jgi:aspartate racemase